MHLEVRYSRPFLVDLQHLDRAAYQRAYEFVFFEFERLDRLEDLPSLHQLGASPLYYRFSLDEFLVAIEVTGHFVKFLRILPKPAIENSDREESRSAEQGDKG